MMHSTSSLIRCVPTWLLLIVAVFVWAASTALADTKGKLTGTVVTKTNEPVIGAHVVLVGTSMGGATDIDGSYFILNIPPGVYEVRVGSVGFGAQLFREVRISADQTTTLNAVLVEEAVQMGEVVVTAEKPIVDVRQTSSVTILGKDQIGVLPVQELNDIVNLQAGVVDGHFRGGRTGEVQYQVDGVSVNNPYDNSSSVRLDRSVIEEVQVISGTFDAEYGQAMSGVVNAVLKSGSEDAIEWSAEIYGGDFVTPDDASRYPRNANVRPNAIQNYQLSVSGPTGLDKTTFLIGGRRYVNEGFLFGERRFMPGDDNELETLTLHPTGDGKTVPMGWTEEWSGQFKLMNRSLGNVSISYQAIGHYSESQRYQHMFRFNPEGATEQSSMSLTHGFEVTHTVSDATFYTVSLRQNYYRYVDYAFEDVFDARYIDYGRPFGDRNYEYGAFVQGVDLSRFKQETSTYIIKASVTSQVTSAHLVKLGVEYQTSEMTFGPPGLFDPYSAFLRPIVDSRDNPGLRTYHPTAFAAYLQDRMEIADFRMRVGARLELFNANTTVPSDLQNPANSITGAPSSEMVDSKIKVALAPRVGISYPITDQGSIFFSYGHFYQMPGLGQLFSNSDYTLLRDLQTGGWTQFGVMGNPNLEPEFTIQYEFGVKLQLGESFGVDVSAFSKDIRNLLGVEFVSTYTSADYARFTNVDFGEVRGFTLAVDQKLGEYLTASLDYTYQMALGNSSDARETANRAAAGEDPRPRQVPLNWDQRHSLNSVLTLLKPQDYTVTGVLRFGSGQPYTPTVLSRLGANLETNSSRKDPYLIVDARGEKSINLFGVNGTIFLRVFNLFNTHQVNGFVFGDTGNPDYTLNPAGNASILLDPSRFYAPRRVEIGLSVNGSFR